MTSVGKQYRKHKEKTERDILELRMLMVKLHRPDLTAEADYLLNFGATHFPYKMIRDIEPFESGFDEKERLPYVVHNGKKLFFPRQKGISWCVNYYTICVRDEAIVGGRYFECHPHQYQSDNCKINEGDVLVDVGCAEALLALDNIDKISKAYLFECNPMWVEPLHATFKDYMDKVKIIDKFVGDHDSRETIMLGTALKEEREKAIFIKMDIEGGEVNVLKGNMKFLTDNNLIKLAVCTYHRQADAEHILSILEEMNYQNEFSEGYMYLKNDIDACFPYFRKGVIRGWKHCDNKVN